MGYFNTPEEVDKYIAEIFRKAADDGKVGPKMKAADITMRVNYTDPDCSMNVHFRDPMTVEFESTDTDADVTLNMKADTADRFWRGKYNLAVGLAKGEVKAKGPVNKILKLVPLTKPLFPMYRELVAEKDEEDA
jgi:putative sterol carrier protein